MSRDVEAERAVIERAIAGRTLCTALADTAGRYPELEALKWRTRDGAWHAHTWRQYRERVRDAALGLTALGFGPGQFAAIMCRNRPEHVIADLGIVHARGTPVTLYSTLAPEQVAHIVGHCGATVAVVEDAAFLETLLKVRGHLPNLRQVVLIDSTDQAASDGVIAWDEVLERGREEHRRDPAAFDEIWNRVRPDDLATLIYTSGTTGPPKAVMDTHRAIFWHWEAWRRLIDIRAGDRAISYLPYAHSAERMGTHWHGIIAGLTVHFCPDIKELLPCLLAVRPTFFIGVPRVWEKLYAGIDAALAAVSDSAVRETVAGALDVGRQVVAYQQNDKPCPDDLRARYEAVRPVLTDVLAKVGLDECRSAAIGAAPVAPEVLEFFHALGVPLAEVWGMTELLAVATASPPGRIKIGSVGPAVAGAEVKLAEDGEILVRTGALMRGYYKDAEKTAEVVDAAGWMHTGDVGEIDAEGYLRIIDRKKELIITAGGKNVSPANLENALKRHHLIGQACVIGDRRPYLTALIVLDPEVALSWARGRGIETASAAELASHREIVAEVGRAVDEVNTHVSRVESIRRFRMVPAEWTAESEELTPTLKLKRRVIADKYADVIDSMYATGLG